MQLNDILADAQDQDRGREFDLLDPVTGKVLGIKLRIAGPDSATQARARLQMVDDLAEMADADGRVSAVDREKARLNTLARCVLGWDGKEDGQPVPFSQANVVRFLKAALWVQQQVDGFASDRAAFRGAWLMDRIEFKAQITVDDAGALSGIAWPFGTPDRVGDVIERGAFRKALPPLPMLAGHDQGQTVGVWDEISETAEGLSVKGRLLVNDVQRAAEVRSLIQAGALRGLSIGFASRKALPRKGGGRTISDLELLEISVVAVPAHPGARITSAKDANMTETTETPDIAALEAKMTDLEKKADTAPIVARLDKLEAKMNRPATDAKAEDEPSEERKAFATYLRLGQNIAESDRKALIVASDPQGGYLAPPEMSSEIIRDLIEYNPMRQFASVRSTSAPSVIYPTRGDVTNARWVGETQTRTESDISFGQKEIDTKELATFVEISNRLLQDAPAAETEVRLALAEDFAGKEAKAFLFGQGVLEPEGLMVNPDIQSLANGHATNLSTDALIALMYSLPQPYRNKGAWVLNGTTLGKLRTLKDGQNNYIWQPSLQVGQPETLLGRPVVEMVDMPDVAANAVPILYGDLQAYRIIDRTQMSVLVDPYTRATNGITRIHATRRVGGAVLQPARFRKLRMATS